MFSDLPKRELVKALESATAQLASADDDLRSFFDAIDDLLFVLDAQGTILFANKAVTAKLGYSAADLAGQSVLFVHPPARRAEAAEIVEAMLAGAATTCPVPVLTKDGREIPVETRVVKTQWRGQEVVFGITRDLTALRASEERFEKAFHVSATPMAITEMETGLYIDVNEAFLTTFGFARDEVLGQSSVGLNLFADPNQRAALIVRMQEQGYLREEEVPYRTKSGSVRYGLFSAEPLHTEGKSLLLTVMVDITEMKQIERMQRDVEERHRLLFETMTQGVVYQDRNGRIFNANPAATQILGLTFDQMQGRTSIDPRWRAMHEDGSDFAGETHPALVALRTGKPVRNVTMGVYSPADDTHHWINVNAIPRFSPGEETPIEVYTTFEDISDQVAAQRELTAQHQALQETNRQLEQSRNMLQLIIESIPLRVFWKDTDLRYLGCNRLFARDAGEESPADLLGKDDFAFGWREQAELYRHDDLEVMRAGQAKMGILEPQTTLTGDTIWVETNKVPLRDVHGAVIGVLGIYEDVTESKRAEQKLAQLHHERELILASTAEGILGLDTEGRHTFVNAAAASLLGYEPDELIGRSSHHTWHHTKADGEPFPEDECPIWATCRNGEMHQATGDTFWRKDGSSFLVEYASAPIFNNGQLAGAVVTFSDITERMEAEEALRASEERYRSLLESLDTMVATVDADGKLLYVNDVGAAHLATTPQHLVGQPVLSLFPASAAMQQWSRIREVFHTNRGTVGESLNIVHGRLRWFRTSLQPIHDKQGRVSQVLLNATDIHEIKKMQQQLLELNLDLEKRVAERTAEVQDLYDNAPAGYHSLAPDGTIVRINQTELRWLGYTAEEMLGRPISDFLTPASSAAFADSIATLRRHGAANDVEREFVRKDGSTLPVLVNMTLVRDPKGNFIMARSVVFDDTVRKAANQALRRANAEMARALRMKDEFLANMSHELRTPLTGVLALSETLQQELYGPINERQARAVNNIQASGRHLLDLINDLLDLAKIEAGKFELNPHIVVVNDVCTASLTFIRSIAATKEIEVSYTCDKPDATLHADPIRLKQILINLLSNAVKFTPEEGSVDLHVSIHPDERQIHFAVTDTGIGIAPTDLDKLFQPFTQLDATLSRAYEGTGLGLALVKRLVDQHGGDVRAESAGIPGQGSRFTVILPYDGQPADTPASTTVPSDTKATQEGDHTSAPLVLLVEDNEVSSEALVSYLEFLGCRVVAAASGAEALDLVTAHRPDLVLMDIQLPGMDGLEVTRRLRLDPRFVSTPIIAVTALAMPGDRERCLAAGATEYISKPLHLGDLRNLMQRVLGP